MNEMYRTTAAHLEIGMQKAYVEILHRIIKNSIKNEFVLSEANRILEQSKSAKERALVEAMKM
jgi:hypothetical protein